MFTRPVAAAAQRLRASLPDTAGVDAPRVPVAVLTELVRRVADGVHRSELSTGLDIHLGVIDDTLAELGTWLAQRAGGAPAVLRPPGFTRTACGRDIARSVAAVAHHAPDELTVARWLSGRSQERPPIEPGWALVAGLGALWRSPFGPCWDQAFAGTPVAPVALALWDEIDELVTVAVTSHRRMLRRDEPPRADEAAAAAALDEVAFTRATAGRAAWERYRSNWFGPYPRGVEDLEAAQLLRLWQLRVEQHGTAVA